MAHAQRRPQRRTRQGGSSRGLPGWAMLTIGLIIGLFVAFLVYLDELQQPPAAAVESGARDTASAARSVSGSKAHQGKSADKPKFEFYSILPDLEVVVPGTGKGESPGTSSGSHAQAQGGEAGGGSAPAGEGRYYLQAGSFQKAAQADHMKAQIALLGLKVDIQSVRIDGAEWHRVRVGPYSDPASLHKAQKRLSDNDIDYLVLRAKKDH